jgi:hypothetical protein
MPIRGGQQDTKRAADAPRAAAEPAPARRSTLRARRLQLAGAGWLALGPGMHGGGGGAARAQDASARWEPPDDADAPVMRPGQRVRRPSGWVEVTTFNRTNGRNESVFSVSYLFLNDGSRDVSVNAANLVRLVTDGIPRAPAEYKGYSSVPAESALDFSATFRVRGRPRVVYLQFGTGDVERSYLRWPD